jgi:hypothetical protein
MVFRSISYSGFLLKSVCVFRNPTETPVTFHEDPQTSVQLVVIMEASCVPCESRKDSRHNWRSLFYETRTEKRISCLRRDGYRKHNVCPVTWEIQEMRHWQRGPRKSWSKCNMFLSLSLSLSLSLTHTHTHTHKIASSDCVESPLKVFTINRNW